MFKFRFGPRYNLIVPSGIVAEEGMNKINALLMAAPTNPDFARYNPNWPYAHGYRLPVDFDPAVLAETGALRGKIAKRVAAYMFNEFKIKLPPSIVTEIGNIAHQYSTRQAAFVFDFTRNFDWQAGDFGDHGSCFFGNRAQDRFTIRENGGFAVRFYNEYGVGFARAWCVPHAGHIVVFNGYGLETYRIARLLGIFFACDYMPIAIYTGIWINGDGGFLLHAPGTAPTSPRVEFRWNPSEIEQCGECQHLIKFNDGYYYERGEYFVCQSCYEERFAYCEGCEQSHLLDDMLYLGEHINHHAEYYCTWCINDLFSTCDRCSRYFDREELNDDDLCPDCAPPAPAEDQKPE